MMRTLLTAVAVTLLVAPAWAEEPAVPAPPPPPPAPAAEKDAGPVRILLITGGCCHDYNYQARKLVDGSKKLANVAWTVMLDPRTGTKAEIDLYNDPDWAKPYDVIVHNECFANTDDAEYIRKITAAHKAGAPAVFIHCAMHTYRAAKIDDWRELLGVTSFHHEHQAEYPIVKTDAGEKHPIMARFPDEWVSPKDELYVIQKIWPNTTPLAVGKSEKNGEVQPAFWINQYGKARVFGTTFGHGNATFDDKVFIETVTRGILWAADKLDKDGNPAEGYGPRAAADGADANCKLCDAKTAQMMNELAAGEGQVPPAVLAAMKNYHTLHAARSQQAE